MSPRIVKDVYQQETVGLVMGIQHITIASPLLPFVRNFEQFHPSIQILGVGRNEMDMPEMASRVAANVMAEEFMGKLRRRLCKRRTNSAGFRN